MKTRYKIIVIILAICGILFVVASSFALLQEDRDLLNYGSNVGNYSTNDTIKLNEDASVNDSVNITKGSYNLVIDCDTKWDINYVIDGKSYQKDGEGKTNISLADVSKSVTIDFNQIDKGYTNLDFYTSNNDFVSSVYQAGKTVKIHYELNVV